ncbi:MAG: transient receptor potential ion channel [Lasallia pustulata]|uniref:Transient receptor potential ion channel n=1 Tax=Lasallia pustulata TaxID=136370 RepID=A0A5M8PYU4_9LECA|nr:MAG: transient receptor potential ion channel [Lasallia pustulata]
MTSSRFGFRDASWPGLSILFLLFFLSLIRDTSAAQDTQVVEATSATGETVYLLDDRVPALYTADFGDCLGSSLINVTRFDAAYYKDNMTVLFHLEGNTAVKNESLMLYIGVFAYGESRFDLTFNPCDANIASLCPMNASVPIEANGIIPVAQSDVAGIPPIALTIPDFEGQAILRIFANSTESEVGCYSAVVTNGNSFSHPAVVGSVLGVFAFVALLASFATAVYGNNIPTMRTHYAHSLSVFVVFSVFQHIYYTGALSMNWPSVLPAFWSNFAWSAGMIYSDKMQNSINQLIGSNRGNLSMVGAASSGTNSNDLGGGYSIASIYKKAVSMDLATHIYHRDLMAADDVDALAKSNVLKRALLRRTLANSTDGYSWYGAPVKPGLPLPGNFSGFAGTLAEQGIPASNAFMTGFLWFLILLAIVAGLLIGFKWLLEGLSLAKLVKKDRLALFREHWLGFTGLAVLRTMFIGFFMMMFLTLFQFTFKGSVGVTAIAAIVFIVFLVGLVGIVGYACFYRLRFGRYASTPDRLHLERTKALGFIPWYEFHRESRRSEKSSPKISSGSLPWWRIHYVAGDFQPVPVHEDEDYIYKFGWLSARFRRTRWWFFAVWLFYEFIRACFFGAAAGHPLTQVFGLLIVEFIALVTIVAMRPFEGARLNAIMVYLLGFSKVATVALSAAFYPRFNLARIPTTAIGVVIIVIQGIVAIALLIAIAVGTISSYMSVTRNQEDFRPRKWAPLREKYFAHLAKAAPDVPPPPPPVPEEPKEPYFNVSAVRRCPKIEDEDGDFVADGNDPTMSRVSVKSGAAHGSRAHSLRSQASYTNVPFGARIHRASWTSRDVQAFHEAEQRRQDLMRQNGMMSNETLPETMQRSRAPSRSGTTLDVRKTRDVKGKGPVVDERQP